MWLRVEEDPPKIKISREEEPKTGTLFEKAVLTSQMRVQNQIQQIPRHGSGDSPHVDVTVAFDPHHGPLQSVVVTAPV